MQESWCYDHAQEAQDPAPTKVVGAGSAMAMFVTNARLKADITATWLWVQGLSRPGRTAKHPCAI